MAAARLNSGLQKGERSVRVMFPVRWPIEVLLRESLRRYHSISSPTQKQQQMPRGAAASLILGCCEEQTWAGVRKAESDPRVINNMRFCVGMRVYM